MEQFQVVTSGNAAQSQSPAQVAVSGGGTNEQVAVMQGIPSAVQVSGAQVAQLSPQPQVIYKYSQHPPLSLVGSNFLK